jgi:hypothetical protein
MPIVSASPSGPDVRIVPENGLWRVEFKNLRWSMPGGMDVLFTVKPAARANAACAIERTWSLATSAPEDGHRLRTFDEHAVPEDYLATPSPIALQVTAHRSESH